jgi:hypothetical protein
MAKKGKGRAENRRREGGRRSEEAREKGEKEEEEGVSMFFKKIPEFDFFFQVSGRPSVFGHRQVLLPSSFLE